MKKSFLTSVTFFFASTLSGVVWLSVITLVSMFSSCSTQDDATPVAETSKGISKSNKNGGATILQAPGGNGGTNQAYITFTNGNFVSSYGGGLNFGGSFPHPLGGNNGDPVFIENGVTFTGGDGQVQVTENHIIITLNNPMRYPNGDIEIFYNGALDEWDIEVSDGEPFQNPASAGKVIVDHNSPTNMSIVSEDYIQNGTQVANPPQTPGTGAFFIGDLVLNGVDFRLSGKSGLTTSGNVTKITATRTSDNVTMSVKSFSLTYALTADRNNYLIKGTINYSGNGTGGIISLTVNNTIASAM